MLDGWVSGLDIDPSYPTVEHEAHASLNAARHQLEAEDSMGKRSRKTAARKAHLRGS